MAETPPVSPKKKKEGPGVARWILRIIAVGVAGVMATGVAAGAYLSRTDAGRDMVLSRVLSEAESRINGTVEVQSLGPTGLLGGATLRQVTARTRDGRVVFTADSISGRYSLMELLSGTSAIADLQLFRPRVLVERDGQGEITLVSMFAQQDTAPPSVDTTAVQSGSDPRFRIRGARIHNGEVVLRLDQEKERVIRRITAEFPRMDLPNRDGNIEASISSFSVRAPVAAGVAVVQDASGRFVLSEGQLTVELARLELPDSRGSGTVFVEWPGNQLVTTADLDLDRVALPDLAWIDPRFDHGVGRGSVRVRIDPREVNTAFDGVDVDVGNGASVALSGELALRNGVFIFRDFVAGPDRFPTSELDPWLSEPLPVEGRVSGRLNLDGPPDRFSVDGSLALLAGSDTLGVAVGAGQFLGNGRVERLTVHLDPVRYNLFRAWDPRLTLRGRGYVHLEASGALPTGLAIQLTALQRLSGFPDSQIRLAGSLYGDSTVSLVDLEGTVSPLSFSALRTGFPDLPVSGEVDGSVSFAGPLEELRMGVDLQTVAGPLQAVATFNALDLSQSYDIRGSVEDFIVSDLVPEAPEPTVVTGALQLRGRGLGKETLQGGLQLNLGSSRISHLNVDSVDATVWVDEGGRLNVEYFYADTEAGSVEAEGGQLGIAPGSRGDGIVLKVASTSIAPLRPFVMKDSLLSDIELSFLVEFEGVDPDTLPTAEELRFDGGVQGTLALIGSLEELTVDADLVGDSVTYGIHSAIRGQVDAVATGIQWLRPDTLPPTAIEVTGRVAADSLRTFGRTFHGAVADGTVSTDGTGRVQTVVQRTPTEEYEAQGVISWQDGAGTVNLDRLTLRFPSRRWNLRGPASFEWNADGVVVNDFGLLRQGGGGLSLLADGRLARRGGESSFSLEVTDLDLDLLSRVIQMDESPVGAVSLDISVTGSSESPAATFQFLGNDLTYRAFSVDRLSGSGSYGGRAIDAEVEAWMGGRRVLLSQGVVPADLRLTNVESRIPDGPLDVSIIADSLPLSLVLGAIEGLEGLRGTIGGEVTLAGVPSSVSPGGMFILENGGARLPGVGLAISNGTATFSLERDGTVSVEGSGRSGGEIEVRGSVGLDDLRNPSFDLAFWPRNFQLVSRRDVVASVSGDSVALTGSFRYPLVDGDITVDEGTVYLEEFERASEAVNFYDPFFSAALRDESGNADVELEGRNPFLQNLRVIVGMSMGRGSWLRSREMNVETAGDLNVTYSRGDGSLVLQGDVRAVRGTYVVASRTFNVTEGTFQFVGTPGFNPNVDIRAENRLQIRDGQPMTVYADLSGTLLGNLQLSLSSDAEVAVSEADLFSYLLLGRPSSALLTDGTAATGAGLNLVLGQVANQIGYLLAPTLNLDYLAVSQAEQTSGATRIGQNGSLRLEAGRYFFDDLFLLGRYQRGVCGDAALRDSFGLQAEIEVTQGVTFESFVEDRCSREGFRGLGDLSFELAKIWGFSIFKQWGY